MYIPSTNLLESFLLLYRSRHCRTFQLPVSTCRSSDNNRFSVSGGACSQGEGNAPAAPLWKAAMITKWDLNGESEDRPPPSEDGEAMHRTLAGSMPDTHDQMSCRVSKWHALYTATHHEKYVKEHLTSRGIECFCPLYRAPRQWKKSKRVVLELPLFPNYVFIRISREQRGTVLGAPGVFSIVGSSQEAWELPDREIEALRSGIHQRNVQPHSYLTVGERARVISGSLAGLEGVIVRDKQNFRIVLTLDQIMRSVCIEVDASELEPISWNGQAPRPSMVAAGKPPCPMFTVAPDRACQSF